jgi:hypothetical protein
MLTITTALVRLRPHYKTDPDLFRVFLNAISAAEANLALQVLATDVPEKELVIACNLREVIAELPATPFPMRVDEETLLRTTGLEKQTALLERTLPDGLTLAVTTAGNLVLDVIVREGAEKHFLTPVPLTDDRISSRVVDLLVESDHLLDALVDLVKHMGLVFNARYYLSVDDFTVEHAFETLSGLTDLF